MRNPAKVALLLATASLTGLAVFAFQATVPQMRVETALPGELGRTTRTVIIKPPNTFTLDPLGRILFGSSAAAPPAPLNIRFFDPFTNTYKVQGSATTLDLVAGSNVILALTPTAPGVMRLQVSAPGSCTSDPATGAVTSCTGGFIPGPGLRLTEDDPKQLIVDADYATARVPMPLGGDTPGAWTAGTSAWYADGQFIYFGVPNSNAAQPGEPQFIRGRVPFQTVW